MKKVFLCILFILSLNIYCQKDVTLFFRNGDSLKVISHLYSGMAKIKYRVSEDSKKIKIDYRKVKKAVKYYTSNSVTYTYKIKKNHATPVLLEQVSKGKIYLYKLDFTRNSNFGGGMSMSSNHSEYYVCKGDDDIVTTFNASGIFIENSFRKKSEKIFNDCPVLVKKIKDKILKMANIPEIVTFYNEKCLTNNL